MWKFCPECGHKLEPSWKFCADCGKQVNATAPGWQWIPLPAYPGYPGVYPNPYIHWTIPPCTVTATGIAEVRESYGSSCGPVADVAYLAISNEHFRQTQ